MPNIFERPPVLNHCRKCTNDKFPIRILTKCGGKAKIFQAPTHVVGSITILTSVLLGENGVHDSIVLAHVDGVILIDDNTPLGGVFSCLALE